MGTLSKEATSITAKNEELVRQTNLARQPVMPARDHDTARPAELMQEVTAWEAEAMAMEAILKAEQEFGTNERVKFDPENRKRRPLTEALANAAAAVK